MTKTARILVAALLLGVIAAGCSEERPSRDLRAELATLRERIAEAETKAERHRGGLIGEMAAMRQEALLLSAALLENRLLAEEGGVPPRMVAPASAPNPARARQILRHIEAAEEQHAKARAQAQRQGGVAAGLAETTAATQELALAQLWLAYYQSAYGLALPGRADERDAPSREVVAGSGAPAPADPARVLDTLAAEERSPKEAVREQAGQPAAAAGGADAEARAALAAKPLPTARADDVTNLIGRVKNIGRPEKTQPVPAPQPVAAAEPATAPPPQQHHYSREQTLRIQLMLQEAGFNPGSIDGRWGPSTESALAQFQRAAGLPADGRPDSRTLDALGLQ